MHYVIGDVHGCFDEMMALITKIEEKDKKARFIFVGDFVDRGPKVWETLEWMMKHISKTGKYQSVCGNHEDLIITWYNEWFRWWEEKQMMPKGQPMGYLEPRTDYDFYKQCKNHNYLYPPKLEPIIKFLKDLPYEKRLNISGIKFHIVHGWKPPKHIQMEDAAKRYYAIWHRHKAGGNRSKDAIIVHGHTPTVLSDSYLYTNAKGLRPGMISYDTYEINIDGGCVFNKYEAYPCMLCAICLETLQEFYHTTTEKRFFEKDHIKDEEEARAEADKYHDTFHRGNVFRSEMLKRIKSGKNS